MMKTYSLKPLFLFLSCLVLLTACNKESFVETVGNVAIESADDTEVGYFVFMSKTTVGACGKITIWIDDKIAGYLTDDYSGSFSNCTDEPIEGKLVKIIAPVGNHTVRVTVANDCRKFNTDNYYLKQGICRFYTLN
ncbi:MAG TPA: hypothetical protein VGN63_13960 [Flavisolibacter sp.]|jgi:hypothetical protein|nr:hypothetical protein [Flavisolibacter sp.]